MTSTSTSTTTTSTTTTSIPPPTTTTTEDVTSSVGAGFEAELYNGYDLTEEPIPLTWTRNAARLGDHWVTYDSPFYWTTYYTSDLGMIEEDEVLETFAAAIETTRRQEEILFGVDYDIVLVGEIATSYGIGELGIIRADLSDYGRGGVEGFMNDQAGNLSTMLGDPLREPETRLTRWDDEVLVSTYADTGLDGQVMVVSTKVEGDVVWSVTCNVTPIVEGWWSESDVEELCWGILGSVAYGHQLDDEMGWLSELFPDPPQTTEWAEAHMVRVEDPLAKLEYRFPSDWRFGWYFGPDVNEPYLGDTGRPEDAILGSGYGDVVTTPYPAGIMFVVMSEHVEPELVKSIVVSRDIDGLGLPLAPHSGMGEGETIQFGEEEAWLSSEVVTVEAGPDEYQVDRTVIRIADPAARLQRGVLIVTCSDPEGESREMCIDFIWSISAFPTQGEYRFYDLLGPIEDNT